VNRALVNAKRRKRGKEDGDALSIRKKMQLVFDGFLQVLHHPG